MRHAIYRAVRAYPGQSYEWVLQKRAFLRWRYVESFKSSDDAFAYVVALTAPASTIHFNKFGVKL